MSGELHEQASAKAKYRGLSTALRFGRDDVSFSLRQNSRSLLSMPPRKQSFHADLYFPSSAGGG
jgi:hypothetical protein